MWVVSRQRAIKENYGFSEVRNAFQAVSNSEVCVLMEVDNFSMDIYSVSRFFQCVMLILCLVFQFMRIVFLAMVRATESILFDLLLGFMLDRSPNRQRGGDSGMWQSRRWERESVMSCQKCLTGVQSHIACMYVSVVFDVQC